MNKEIIDAIMEKFVETVPHICSCVVGKCQICVGLRDILEKHLLKEEEPKIDIQKTEELDNLLKEKGFHDYVGVYKVVYKEEPKKLELLEMDNGASEARTMKQNILRIASYLNSH